MCSLFRIFCLAFLLLVQATSHASLLPRTCAEELDQAVNAYNGGKAAVAESKLQRLLGNCAHLPQVHHNLGVIAAAEKNWGQATEHFDRAILNDTRTTNTIEHQQFMHQYRATKAYQDALHLKKEIPLPDFQMQMSTTVNTHFRTLPKTDQHNAPTVDYELYAWWTAASHNDASAWQEHYTPGYPPMENNDAKFVDWNDVSRDISFTAQDAVVVLSYQQADIDKRMLLLLRLQNNRWKIYRQANL